MENSSVAKFNEDTETAPQGHPTQQLQATKLKVTQQHLNSTLIAPDAALPQSRTSRTLLFIPALVWKPTEAQETAPEDTHLSLYLSLLFRESEKKRKPGFF